MSIWLGNWLLDRPPLSWESTTMADFQSFRHSNVESNTFRLDTITGPALLDTSLSPRVAHSPPPQ